MNGAELADAVRIATNGVVHSLPTDARWPSFGIAIAPAGCVVLVRDHGSTLTASLGRRAWRITRGQGMPVDLPLEAVRWAASHADETTLVDAALALAPVLDSEIGEHWVLSIPGGQPAPTEMWLHPSGDPDRASVGVFATSFHIGAKVVPMPKGRRLSSAFAPVVQHVREQLTAYRRNVALSEECKRIAADLAARLGKTAGVRGAPTAGYGSPITTIVTDGRRQLATVSYRDEALVVDAGLPAERGWHGKANDALGSSFDALARAVAMMEGAVTYDDLEYNARYRVLLSHKGLQKGEIVTYGGPIDNHAPHTFMNDAGKEILIDEYDLRENVDRLFTPE